MNYRKLVKTAVSIQRKYASLSLDEETREALGPTVSPDFEKFYGALGDPNEEPIDLLEEGFGDEEPSEWPWRSKPLIEDDPRKSNIPETYEEYLEQLYKGLHKNTDSLDAPMSREEWNAIHGDKIENDDRFGKAPRSREQFSGSTAPKDREEEYQKGLDIEDRMRKSKGDDRLLPNQDWDEDDWELSPEEWAEIEG